MNYYLFQSSHHFSTSKTTSSIRKQASSKLEQFEVFAQVNTPREKRGISGEKED